MSCAEGQFMKGQMVLWPSPRQQLFLIGSTYFVCGYLMSGCWWRMAIGLAFCWAALNWCLAVQWMKRLPRRALLWAGALGLVCFWVLVVAPSALAQQAGDPGSGGYVFLGKLCGLMAAAAAPAGVGNAAQIQGVIRAVVNILRVLFLVYLVIALVTVFNALREGEDVQTVARTPILAVVVVGIVEALSVLIGGQVASC